MTDQEKTYDPFDENIIKNLPPNVSMSLTSEQKSELKKAYINSWGTRSKHAVDIRGVVPFFVNRFYFCFYMGVDVRSSKNKINNDRRNKSSKLPLIVFWCIVIIICVSFAALFSLLFSSPHLQNFPRY